MTFQVIVFYILTLLFTVLLGGLQQATGFLPSLSIPQFGPAIAALVTLLIFKKSRVKLNFSFKDVRIKAAALSILLPVLAAAILLLFKGMWIESSPGQTLYPLLAYVWIPFGALGEETGWRGYLHKSLNRKIPWMDLLPDRRFTLDTVPCAFIQQWNRLYGFSGRCDRVIHFCFVRPDEVDSF
jgi:membrane protease YdiL (CAAX protease family)